MPVLEGTILPFAGAVVPNGYLPCDGTAVSRVVYKQLFLVVGTTWGAGDGMNDFNVPDLRGRTLIGEGQGPGLSLRKLGTQNIGTERVAIQPAELPSHSHAAGNLVSHASATGVSISGQGDHGHVTDHSGAHQHRNSIGKGNDGPTDVLDAIGLHLSRTTTAAMDVNVPPGSVDGNHHHTIPHSGGHNHTLHDPGHGHQISGSTANYGAGSQHENMQPAAVVNWIIKH